ncbi:ATP-binding protein [Embleya sp. NBC_00896]|uniref:ATP-binding protein n=1 Tax=Embleya sp. NBC_00896 TaxID=2975961 RepID=UPI00386C7450|nr:ATP-binding protein [Embleya sp. NBC_00896]
MSVCDALPPEELRTLFLFEKLADEHLNWLCEHGKVKAFPANTTLYNEGDPGECFFVLLTGEVTMNRVVRGGELEVHRSSMRGAYVGAALALNGDGDTPAAHAYGNTARTHTDSTFFVLPAGELAQAFTEWFPMAAHLVAGMFLGGQRNRDAVGQRERMIALGTLTAGLTHELGNPAAAAERAAAGLRGRLGELRRARAELAEAGADAAAIQALARLQDDVLAHREVEPPRLRPLEFSDRTDEVAEFFEDLGIPEAYDTAPAFVHVGLYEDWARAAGAALGPAARPGLSWLAATLEGEALLDEVADALGRITELLAAAGQYTQMDRAPYQETDLRKGLDSTVAMLAGPLRDIRIERDYAADLPRIQAYPAELNQVWTNLIDNAADAMAGEGTLTLRASSDPVSVVIEIEDTGPGIPRDIQDRIFEPFFTTKTLGEGTGLGLDISYRIIVQRHAGSVAVFSEPGRTTFRITLPR